MNELPAAGVMRVIGPENAGAGFLVTSGGLIVTCAHVLTGSALGATVRVEPHAGRQPLEAIVVLLKNPPDVAVLQLTAEVPREAAVLPLGRSPQDQDRRQGLLTFGYPRVRPETGFPGEVIIIPGGTADGGYRQLALDSNQATLGFSGAPIWDPDRGAVVGMVKGIVNDDPGQRLKSTCLGVPAEVIRDLYPELRLPVGCPYRGLEPFTGEHADYYYGREHATSQLLASLAARDFVAVVAVSGGGKSSLLQAGLTKGLQAQPILGLAQRVRCYQRVGSRPHAELFHCVTQQGISLPRELAEAPPAEVASAVRGGAPRAGLIIVADQFERLYTDCADAERKRFIELLLHLATGKVKVVIGLRADFYHLALADLGERLAAGQVALAPMSEQDLSRAITEPAGRLLRSFQPGLAQQLAADVRGRPGDLPLLQFALTRLWELDQADVVLTEESYRRLGFKLPDNTYLPGAQGALISQAEDLWNGLDEADRQRLQRILLRLIAVQPAGTSASPLADSPRDLSRPAPLAQWGKDDQPLIQRLIDARLLTANKAVDGQATVEVSHEVLLRAWPRLRTWLEEHEKFVRWWAQDLAPNLERWLRSGKSPGSNGNPEFLLRRSLLDPALGWLGDYSDWLKGPPADYIRASKRRRTLRRGLASGAVAVLVITSLIAAGIFYNLRQAAVQQRNTAISERNVAASNALVDQSEATGASDPVMARLEAVAAWRLDPSPQAGNAMLSAAVIPWTAALTSDSTNPEESVAFSPRGTLLAAVTENGTQLWDIATRKLAATLPAGIGNSADSVAFSPGGTLLATGTTDGIQLWDIATRKLVTTLTTDAAGVVLAVAFGPEGTLLAAGTSHGTTQLWDITRRRLVAKLPSTTSNDVSSVAFSPDGTLLAANSDSDNPLLPAKGVNGTQLWDVATRKLVATLPAAAGNADAVAFSPGGTLLAAATRNGMQVWDVATRKLAAMLSGGTSFVAVAFSPDGTHLAADTTDGTQLWDVAARKLVTTLPAATSNSVNSVAFDPHGALLAVGTNHGTWLANLADGIMPSLSPATLPASTLSNPHAVAFSPNGTLLAAHASDGTIHLWDVATRKLAATLPSSTGMPADNAIAFSPDGTLLAATTTYQTYSTIQIWNIATRKLVATLPAPRFTEVDALAFSPDGSLLAAGATDSTQLWDVAKRKLVTTLLARTGWINSVAFSPDGTLLAAGTFGPTELWDVATRKLVATLPTAVAGTALVAFSPDGTVLAVGTENGTQLWDVAARTLATTLPTGFSIASSSVAFSPDGTVLAICNGTIAELWDVKTTRQFASLSPGHAEFATFNRNGTLLAVVSYGEPIQLLVPYPTNTVSYLCGMAGESFPPDQWAKYAPGVPYMKICP